MFNHKHYVPILRWKRAEWVALGKLTREDREHITPLVEPTPWSFQGRNNKPAPNPADVLTKNAADLREHWGVGPFFVDLWHVNPSLRVASHFHPLEFLAEQARTRGLALIPVTGLHRDRHYQSAVTSVIARDCRGKLAGQNAPCRSPVLRISRESFEALESNRSGDGRNRLSVGLSSVATRCSYGGNAQQLDT